MLLLDLLHSKQILLFIFMLILLPQLQLEIVFDPLGFDCCFVLLGFLLLELR